ncbi:hypothetical protein FGO68_gene16710 [Halteria grandinella]|uniref:Uncharacterized protein n=1 Tax=Halteria grandinella TaxID=5974 RepID=A0A8J8NV20_HALGN|nr:hypothetical protein FGO68_gene16710 [Halteria grandinella]
MQFTKEVFYQPHLNSIQLRNVIKLFRMLIIKQDQLNLHCAACSKLLPKTWENLQESNLILVFHQMALIFLLRCAKYQVLALFAEYSRASGRVPCYHSQQMIVFLSVSFKLSYIQSLYTRALILILLDCLASRRMGFRDRVTTRGKRLCQLTGHAFIMST